MTAPIITSHAIQRYQERVANIPEAQIIERLNCAAVRAAISFGAPYVRLPSKHHIVIQDGKVVTVLPPDTARYYRLAYGR